MLYYLDHTTHIKSNENTLPKKNDHILHHVLNINSRHHNFLANYDKH